MEIAFTVEELPRSTCHQALDSRLVVESEALPHVPSVLPSTARAAIAPGYVLLCEAVLPRAMFEPALSKLRTPVTTCVAFVHPPPGWQLSSQVAVLLSLKTQYGSPVYAPKNANCRGGTRASNASSPAGNCPQQSTCPSCFTRHVQSPPAFSLATPYGAGSTARRAIDGFACCCGPHPSAISDASTPNIRLQEVRRRVLAWPSLG